MTVVTVELEDDMLERVRRYSEKKQMAISDVLTTSLNRFLLLAELSEFQNRLEGKASKFGFDSEDDLLNAIS
jgi:predicted transcriptional regulator